MIEKARDVFASVFTAKLRGFECFASALEQFYEVGVNKLTLIPVHLS